MNQSLNKLNKSKILYESSDDVLTVRVSDEKIDSAEKEGDVVIHFSKSNKPVLFEIFNAVSFLKRASHSLPQSVRERVFA